MDDETFDLLSAMLDEPYQEYWAELGRFIHYFSAVESGLQALVHHFSGVEAQTAKAIFHGLRIDNAKDLINRMLEAQGRLDVRDRLKDPLAQLGVIANVRNSVVHWGARDTHGEGLVVSNAHMAFSRDRIRRFQISAADLMAMRADLHKIEVHFLVELFRREESVTDLIAKLQERVLGSAWLYKPPQQSLPPKARRSPAPSRSRSRPHDTSEA